MANCKWKIFFFMDFSYWITSGISRSSDPITSTTFPVSVHGYNDVDYEYEK